MQSFTTLRQSPSVKLRVAVCALVIGISLQRLFLANSNVDGPPSVETASLKKSSHAIMPAEEIDPEAYYVFDNSCLEPTGLYQWTVRVTSKRRFWKSEPKAIKFLVYHGASGFVFHNISVIHDQQLDVARAGVQKRKGTYMLLANTHANNYHIICDLLLPAFRARLTTRINGLLIPEGCVDCWRGRLPLQSLGLDMMNLEVVYPLENATSMAVPMCFDRLIIQRFEEKAYYIRKGRFSKFWPREIFVGFRDSARDYFQTLLQEVENVQPDASGTNTEVAITVGIQISTRNKTTGNSIGVAQTSHNQSSKPVLSWMSRSTLHRRITNEREIVAQLSKYFHVNMLDFDAGLTTEQAMAYVMNTDVLIGLHGAGLAYTAFLPDRAMLVELRSNYGNRMFINMASSMDVPYYALSLAGCIGPGENDVFTLPLSMVGDMTEEIYSAYLLERLLFSQGRNLSSGECEFPQLIEPCGYLSPINESRCYLQPLWDDWFQCAWHDRC